jgi:hypothetical protein
MTYFHFKIECVVEADSLEEAQEQAEIDFHQMLDQFDNVIQLEDQWDELINLPMFCSLCSQIISVNTAHFHQSKFIGECCWDDRLKSSE